MCGIAGFIDSTASRNAKDLECLGRNMAEKLKMRGPDDEGIWTDENHGVVLAHRRLSILDLTAMGHQPMSSHDGRYIIVYNGEVYNAPLLKIELEKRGYSFQGGSDTEVLLEAIACWGIPEAVQRCNGMFAFAVWDVRNKILTLGRDRIGIKPLYYGWTGDGNFFFGSEIKALRCLPRFVDTIDQDALSLFFRHNYIPAPFAIFKNLRKLKPGHILILRKESLQNRCTEVFPYWTLADSWLNRGCPTHSEREWEEQLESLLHDSVRSHLLSDVPLGAFLSGGIDSSVVVAIMQSISTRPVQTFTIGFESESYNEALIAKGIADHLQTDHHELYVTHNELLDAVPQLAKVWDEPFADSSQIPMLLVAKMAKRNVTVVLSGDGGDELFGGYRRYRNCINSWSKFGKISPVIKAVLASIFEHIPEGPIERKIGTVIKAATGIKSNGFIVNRLHELLASKSFGEFYGKSITHQMPKIHMVCGSTDMVNPLFTTDAVLPESRLSEMSMYDICSYLPDDILVKVDRATMAVGLEARVPFLDHRLVELAGQIPDKHKISGETTKKILRNILFKHLPENFVSESKHGFSVPMGSWLAGPLLPWANDLLSEASLKNQTCLNGRVVTSLWDDFKKGKRKNEYLLWNVLSFQAWLIQ